MDPVIPGALTVFSWSRTAAIGSGDAAIGRDMAHAGLAFSPSMIQIGTLVSWRRWTLAADGQGACSHMHTQPTHLARVLER